MYDQAGAA
jgi:cell division protein FtsB